MPISVSEMYEIVSHGDLAGGQAQVKSRVPEGNIAALNVQVNSFDALPGPYGNSRKHVGTNETYYNGTSQKHFS